MYSLQVHYPDCRGAQTTVRLDRAADILSRVADLLREHGGCEKVVVLSGTTLMFSIDRNGDHVFG